MNWPFLSLNFQQERMQRSNKGRYDYLCCMTSHASVCHFNLGLFYNEDVLEADCAREEEEEESQAEKTGNELFFILFVICACVARGPLFVLCSFSYKFSCLCSSNIFSLMVSWKTWPGKPDL